MPRTRQQLTEPEAWREIARKITAFFLALDAEDDTQ